MAKGEISWKGSFEDGRKRQAYAKKIGRNWRFFDREKRYDNWEPVLKPEFEDWIALLDGVDRRVHRHRKLMKGERKIMVAMHYVVMVAEPPDVRT